MELKILFLLIKFNIEADIIFFLENKYTRTIFLKHTIASIKTKFFNIPVYGLF